jgi:hypothetical protein
MIALARVFHDAALPQKTVFVVLLASILWALVSGALELSASCPKRRRLLVNLGFAAPALGLLVGSMNAFHMMDTTLRLPASPSAKDLAAGVMEIAAMMGLGALAGLVAIVFTALNWARAAPPE